VCVCVCVCVCVQLNFHLVSSSSKVSLYVTSIHSTAGGKCVQAV
jgi:hypothetical protein